MFKPLRETLVTDLMSIIDMVLVSFRERKLRIDVHLFYLFSFEYI